MRIARCSVKYDGFSLEAFDEETCHHIFRQNQAKPSWIMSRNVYVKEISSLTY